MTSRVGRLIAVLLVACSPCGCDTLDELQWRCALRGAERRNAEAARQYREIVARQAGNEQLVGTWVGSGYIPKRFGPPPTLNETVSLFSDGSYVQRTRTVMHGLPEAITVLTGKWEKMGPGRIKLALPGTAGWRIIDLEEWTNIFVRADADLMSEKNLESHSKPLERASE